MNFEEKGPMTETYSVKGRDGGVRFYIRATPAFYRETDDRYKKRGWVKESVVLANGKTGFVWR